MMSVDAGCFRRIPEHRCELAVSGVIEGSCSMCASIEHLSKRERAG